MDIGVLGAGHIGTTTAKLFADAGHDVALSNSRDPGTLRDTTAKLGDRVRATTPAEAAAFGELVLLAIPFRAYTELPAAELAGKIVVDATNYYPSRDGDHDELEAQAATSSELIARHLPGARLVKAFNTMHYEQLATPAASAGGDRLVLFLAGDDTEAKRVVANLIEQVGFDPVDTGGLRDGGRRQQPGSPIYNQPTNAARARQLLDGEGA